MFRTALEVLPQHGLRFSRTSRRKQRRAKVLAGGHVPVMRFLIHERVLVAHGAIEVGDRLVELAALERDLAATISGAICTIATPLFAENVVCP